MAASQQYDVKWKDTYPLPVEDVLSLFQLRLCPDDDVFNELGRSIDDDLEPGTDPRKSPVWCIDDWRLFVFLKIVHDFLFSFLNSTFTR